MRLQRPKGNAESSGICFPTEGLLHIHKDLKKWCWSCVHFVVFIEAFVIVHHWRTWWRSLAQYRWFLETWHCCNLCSTFLPYTHAFLFDGTATRKGVGVLPKITFTFMCAYFRNHHMSTLCIVNRHITFITKTNNIWKKLEIVNLTTHFFILYPVLRFFSHNLKTYCDFTPWLTLFQFLLDSGSSLQHFSLWIVFVQQR